MKVLDCLPAMADVMEGAVPLLRVAGLSHAFGGLRVLKDVAVELRAGEVVLLRGANGSGKTTLLNILTGNLVPDRGSIDLSKPTLRYQVRVLPVEHVKALGEAPLDFYGMDDFVAWFSEIYCKDVRSIPRDHRL